MTRRIVTPFKLCNSLTIPPKEVSWFCAQNIGYVSSPSP